MSVWSSLFFFSGFGDLWILSTKVSIIRGGEKTFLHLDMNT